MTTSPASPSVKPDSASAATAKPADVTSELWRTFHARLRRFLRQRVKDDAVDDVLQDVFFRAHRSLSGGEVPRDPTAWVFRIARTTVIDHYRSRAADKSAPCADVGDSVEVTFADPFDDDVRAELARCVQPLVQGLSPSFREALTWTDLQGQSQVDAAKRAGISVSGMKSRVQRARRQLAAHLQACCAVEVDARGSPMSGVEKCSTC